VSESHEPLLSVVVRYGYFVVQARVTRMSKGHALSGVLEDLGTGEKLPFEGGEGLARLVEAWGKDGGTTAQARAK